MHSSNGNGNGGGAARSSKVEFVSPARAEEYLARLDESRARPLNSAWADELAGHIAAGTFDEDAASHQGIAFDDAGNLSDGRHRLTAIVRAGRGVRMRVNRGLPRRSCEVIDTAWRRTDTHAAMVRGIPATTYSMSIAVRALVGPNSSNSVRQVRRGARLAFYEQHREAIEWAAALGWSAQTSRSSSQVRLPAPMAAVLMRAQYTHPRGRLERFVEVFRTCVCSDPSEEPAARLSKYYHAEAELGSEAGRREFYLKCERAVQSFLSGEPLGKLYQAAHELFPLPEERAAGPVDPLA